MMKIFNFTKNLANLLKPIKKKHPKLSTEQIDELIEINKETLNKLGDEADYDGMGNYGRFPPIKKTTKK